MTTVRRLARGWPLCVLAVALGACNVPPKYDLMPCGTAVEVVFPSNPAGTLTAATVCVYTSCASQPLASKKAEQTLTVAPYRFDLPANGPWTIDVTVHSLHGTTHISARTTPRLVTVAGDTCYDVALRYVGGHLERTAFRR